MKRIRPAVILFFLWPAMIFAQELSLKENKEFKGLGSYINQAAFSPFNNYFVYSTGENIIRVLNRDWEKIYEHQGDPESGGSSFTFSPDGKFLAIGRYKGKTDIAIFSLEERKVLQVLDRHRSYIYELKFSNDGNYISSCGYDSEMILWKRTGESFTFHKLYEGFESYLYESTFSHDDRFLATGDSYGHVKIYEKEGQDYRLFQEFQFRKHGVSSILFRPGTYELLAGSSYGLRRYKLNTTHFELSDSVSEKAYVRQPMNFSPQGTYLAITHYNQIKVFKMHRDSMELVDIIRRHLEETTGSTFSEDGKFLTTYASDEKIIIWEVENVRPSDKAMVSSWLLGSMSLAQRRSLTPAVCERIIKNTPGKLSAPRDEFEKTIEYNNRREQLSDHALGILQQEMEKIYQVKRKGSTVSFPVTSIVGYNADMEIYKIMMLDTEAGLRIPVDEARKFKEDWKRAIISADKNFEKEKESASYENFQLTFPASKDKFEVTPLENPFQQSSAQFQTDEAERKRRVGIQMLPGEIDKDTVNGNTYALLFATNVYDFFSDLVNPVIDAQTIANELEENYGVFTEVVVNATLEETAGRIRKFASRNYGAKDNLLVFFAGHGEYDAVFREGYVISRDSKADDFGKTSYLSHSNLRTMINNIDCPHIFLVMDVCFGGTFDPHLAASHRGSSQYADISTMDYVERKLKYKTRLYLTSGGKEYVPDGRPGFHSPFARRFIESLRHYGGDDGVLTTAEILQFVDKTDPQPRFGEFGDNEPGSDFILVLKSEEL